MRLNIAIGIAVKMSVAEIASTFKKAILEIIC